MSVNKFQPHIHVIPEDDANRQIANGFMTNVRVQARNIQVRPIAGGWRKVLKSLQDAEMEKHKDRRVILLLDFDDREEQRKEEIQQTLKQFSTEIQKRIYVLGTQQEPENLRTACNKSFEEIGKTLVKECAENEQELWAHKMLAHNASERARLMRDVAPFLFKP